MNTLVGGRIGRMVMSGLCASAVLITPVPANSRELKDIDIKSALENCLWGMVFKENTEQNRTLSLILNLVAGGVGSIAVTSAVTAPKDYCVDRGRARTASSTGTHKDLVEETAVGSGKHIDALLAFSGCESAAVPAVLRRTARPYRSAARIAPGYGDGLRSRFRVQRRRSVQGLSTVRGSVGHAQGPFDSAGCCRSGLASMAGCLLLAGIVSGCSAVGEVAEAPGAAHEVSGNVTTARILVAPADRQVSELAATRLACTSPFRPRPGKRGGRISKRSLQRWILGFGTGPDESRGRTYRVITFVSRREKARRLRLSISRALSLAGTKMDMVPGVEALDDARSSRTGLRSSASTISA